MNWSEEECLLPLGFMIAPIQRSIKLCFHVACGLLILWYSYRHNSWQSCHCMCLGRFYWVHPHISARVSSFFSFFYLEMWEAMIHCEHFSLRSCSAISTVLRSEESGLVKGRKNNNLVFLHQCGFVICCCSVRFLILAWPDTFLNWLSRKAPL